MEECAFCDKSAKISSLLPNRDAFHVACNTCGKYNVSGKFTRGFKTEEYKDVKHLLSGIIREETENGRTMTFTEVDDVQKTLDSHTFPSGFFEIIDRILLYVHNKSNHACDPIWFSESDHPIAYAKDFKELKYHLFKSRDLKYLELLENLYKEKEVPVRLDVEGWKRIDELRRRQGDSNKAFVAMWFNENLKSAWMKGFKPALKETGYDPIRIDEVHHNDKIDDQIIANIRKSGLLIADFSGHRGGVYFEAGFAMGLGIPVIWTCNKEHEKKIHFDTRQYNHILWEKPEDLKEKLINRIEATLSNRKYKTKVKSNKASGLG